MTTYRAMKFLKKSEDDHDIRKHGLNLGVEGGTSVVGNGAAGPTSSASRPERTHRELDSISSMVAITLAYAVLYASFIPGRSFSDPEELAETLSSLMKVHGAFGLPGKEIVIDARLLGHAVHMYKPWLEKKLHWTIDRLQSTERATRAFGYLPAKVHTYSGSVAMHSEFRLSNHAQQRLDAFCEVLNKLVSWKYGDSWKLCNGALTIPDCVDVGTVITAVGSFYNPDIVEEGKENSFSTSSSNNSNKYINNGNVRGSTSTSFAAPIAAATPTASFPPMVSPLATKRTWSQSISTLPQPSQPSNLLSPVSKRPALGSTNSAFSAFSSVTSPISLATNRSSPTAREEILASNHSSLSSLISSFNHSLEVDNADTQYCYINKGFPDIDSRRRRVKDYMEPVYSMILQGLTSERHQKMSARSMRAVQRAENSELLLAGTKSVTEMDAHWDERAEKMRTLAVTLCELIAGACVDGQAVTPARVQLALLLALGNVSESILDHVASLGLCCSSKTTKSIMKGISEQKELTLYNKLTTADQLIYMIMVMIDNYAVMRYSKQVGFNRTLTEVTPTISVLTCLLHRASLSQALALVTPGAKLGAPINFDKMMALAVAGKIVLPEYMKTITDPGVTYQGLGNYNVIPNISGRSSSYADTKEKVLHDLLLGKLKLGEREIALVVDTEYDLAINRLRYMYPELTENLLILPCIFHVRMHLLQNQMTDPVMLVLWVYPMYDAIGLQKEQARVKVKQIVEKMKAVIAAAKSRSSTNGSSSSGGGGGGGGGGGAQQPDEDSDEDDDGWQQEHDEQDDNEAQAESDNEDTQQQQTQARPHPGQQGRQESTSRGRRSILRFVALAQRHLQRYPADEPDDDDDGIYLPGEDGTYGPQQANLAHLDGLFSVQETVELLQILCAFMELKEREKGTLFSHREKNEHKKNYARVLNIAKQMHSAGRDLPPGQQLPQHPQHTEDPAQPTHNIYWAANMFTDHIQEGISRLGVDPFADIILNGSAASFLELLPTMCNYLAHCRRDKVCKSLLVSMGQIAHLLDHRPDALCTYMANATKANDNAIENHNARISKTIAQRATVTPEAVAKASTDSELKRELLSGSGAQDLAGTTLASSHAPHRGEIHEEELRHQNTRGREQIAFLSDWAKRHHALLVEAGRHVRPPSRGATSVAACEENGARRMVTEIIPEYQRYLAKLTQTAAQQDPQQQPSFQSPAELADQAHLRFLNKLTVPMLQGFLLSKGCEVRGVKHLANKAGLVQYTKENFSTATVCEHLIEQNIDDNDYAIAYLKALKAAVDASKANREAPTAASIVEFVG